MSPYNVNPSPRCKGDLTAQRDDGARPARQSSPHTGGAGPTASKSPSPSKQAPAAGGPPDAAAGSSCPSPLLALGHDCLARCLSWLPDPTAAALACRALAACTADDEFALEWFASRAAGDGGACDDDAACGAPSSYMRAVAWRRMRGLPAAAVARRLIAARRHVRRRREAAAAPLQLPYGTTAAEPRISDPWDDLGAVADLGRGASDLGGPSGGFERVAADLARRAADEEARQEEEDAALLLEVGRPCAALLLLAGPYAQHLLLPLAARCGDLALLAELESSGDIPLRPLLLDGDAATQHYVMATAAKAAMRAGRVEAAAWVVKRLLTCVDEVGGGCCLGGVLLGRLPGWVIWWGWAVTIVYVLRGGGPPRSNNPPKTPPTPTRRISTAPTRPASPTPLACCATAAATAPPPA
jgi:hypothetical protein